MELPFNDLDVGRGVEPGRLGLHRRRTCLERFSDIHLLAVHVHGPGVIHTTNAPIESIADFDGLQLRGPSRMANALLEELGANARRHARPGLPRSG